MVLIIILMKRCTGFTQHTGFCNVHVDQSKCLLQRFWFSGKAKEDTKGAGNERVALVCMQLLYLSPGSGAHISSSHCLSSFQMNKLTGLK